MRQPATRPTAFEAWPTAGLADFRRLKARVKIDTSTGVASLTAFKPIADVADRTEKAEAVTIAVAGTTITYAERFHVIPNIQVSASGASALFPVKSAEAVTGFTVKVYDSGGVDVGGTVDWQANGA